VGRSEELRFIADALVDGSGRGVVVSGGAGVGKTRLAREVVDIAAQSGLSTEWTVGSFALASIPFGAVAHLLPEARAETIDNRLDLLRGIAGKIGSRDSWRGMLFAVDDAHLLDEGSAALVQHLVVTGKASTVITAREGEPVSDAITALWKDGYVDRLELQPLGPLDVSDLLTRVLDGSIEAETADRFWNLSAGNVLLLRELVVAARVSGGLRRVDGVWTWEGELQPSSRMQEMLQSRIARLHPAAAGVMEHVALEEPLPLAVVTACCDTATVASMERAGLIAVSTEDGEQVVRSAHPLYPEVVRAALGPARRRAIREALADALSSRIQTPRDRLRLAVWRLDGPGATDAALMTDAAHIANALFDHVLAERLARRAVEVGGPPRAALILGDALNRIGRGDEGQAVLADLAGRAETDRERADIAIARFYGLTVDHGSRRQFESVLLDAERAVQDPALLAYLRAQRATLLTFSGDFEAGLALASEPLPTGPAVDTAMVELATMRRVPALGLAWTLTGRTDRAHEMASRLLERALRRDDSPVALYWVGSMLMVALIIGGRLAEADEMVGFGEQAFSRFAGPSQEGSYLTFARGLISVMRGQAEPAQKLLRQSLSLRSAVATPAAAAFLVEAYAMTEDASGAEEAATVAEEAIDRFGAFEGVIRRARVWLHVARGDLSAAAQVALDEAAWAREHGHRTAELFALHDAVRLGRTAGVVPRLSELASHSEHRWAPTFLTHARAAAAHDGHQLEATTSSFEEAGAYLRAAEAATQAAAAYQRRGLSGRAARAATRARLLLAKCEGARPPTASTISEPVPLTQRERDVVRLAAQGLTSREVGERLHLSARTVEGHLMRAYEKLGIHDRADLRRIYAADSDYFKALP